jgi:aspartyl-tRNA(Asn)/glutamyl-tRNA(Gln) amidotransferase subunit C
MALTIEEVRKISELARIKLTAEEEQRYATTISAVLDYMTILNEVPTDGVVPTFQVTGLEDVFRQDVVEPSLLDKKLLAQMPATELDELVVPEVFEA